MDDAEKYTRQMAANAKWRAKNREQERQRVARWRKENPEAYRAMYLAYAAANREQERQRSAVWRSANAERHKARSRKWRAENPEKQRAQGAIKRARKRLLTPILTCAEKEQMLSIYAGAHALTEMIGTPYHVDHIVPLVKGGLHHPSNLQVLRAIDNMRKGTK